MYTAYKDVDQDALKRDIDEIKNSIGKPTQEDFAHLLQMERWGRALGILGYTLIGLAPYFIVKHLDGSGALIWLSLIVGAFFVSFANIARWANVAHPVLHGAYDRVDGVPKRYTRKGFAQGPFRRLVDWLDWITPQAWDIEHNRMHHYSLGEESDPDNVEHLTKFLTESKIPMPVRYVMIMILTMTWKPLYYAPNTMKMLDNDKRRRAGQEEIDSLLSFWLFTPFTSPGRTLWKSYFGPYILFRFIIVPALFLPLGAQFAIYVLIASLIAEVMTNFHSFMVIVPNHSADDIYHFSEPHKNMGEFYLRQIMGSVNYCTGNNMIDFSQGWLNYQIEHHLFPNLPLSQYQKMQPLVKDVCKKHGLEYRQQSVFVRWVKTIQLMVGKTKGLTIDHI